MVIAYHITIGAYGFWLPNDPRGSWSTDVWARQLRPYGAATIVATRRSLARRQHDHETRIAAKRQLKYDPVKFNGPQARAIGAGFAGIIRKMEWTVYACAIMPDHAHLVMPCHDRKSEEIVRSLKRAATRQLNAERMHPHAGAARPNGRTPSPWVEGDGWRVYLNSPEEVRRAIRYVEQNPVKSGLPPQTWSFVVPYRE